MKKRMCSQDPNNKYYTTYQNSYKNGKKPTILW